MIALDQCPQLRLLLWNRARPIMLEEEDAFSLYERSWRFIEPEKFSESESEIFHYLLKKYGKGALNV